MENGQSEKNISLTVDESKDMEVSEVSLEKNLNQGNQNAVEEMETGKF
ncbi:MAG: hypothetical protein JW870_01835 [Candidatus Delongbacteria bacterium]|nr:hypothetical protein [Candidatus Delongbacteria bacterium]